LPSDEARVIRQQIKARIAEIEAFTARIERILAQTIHDIARGVENFSSDQTVEKIAFVSKLFDRADELGLSVEIEKLKALYASEIKFIKETLSRSGVEAKFTDIDKALIQQLVTFDAEKVTNKIREYGISVQGQLTNSVVAGVAPDVNALIGDRLKSTAGNIATELNTAASGFARSVVAQKAIEAGFDLYEYIGPFDSLTRDFCQMVLDRSPPIYTLDEISGLQSEQGQGLDVLVYGGGYNCRHQWRPISEEDARLEGWEP